MMSTWLAAGVALAAIAATYFCCVRPAMRGQCAASRADTGSASAELDRQLGELREEVRVLHAQDLLDANSNTDQTPPGPRQVS